VLVHETHLKGSTDFYFQTQFLQFVSIFSNENPFNDQYLLHLCSENCEINSGNSNSLEGFPTTPRTLPNSTTIFSFNFIYFFIEKNVSIVNTFPHCSSKQSQTKLVQPYLSRDFQKYQEINMMYCGLGDLSVTKQNKTTYLAS